MDALIHLSELHGAATHLAVVGVPVAALLVVLRRRGTGGETVTRLEPIALGTAVAGVALAGATGLLVQGEASTELRGSAGRLGTLHFWIGIAIAVLVALPALARVVQARRRQAPSAGGLLAGTLVAVVLAAGLVVVQGYLGGRQTYEHGVGVEAGGQFRQTATGAETLHIALAKGTPRATAGQRAFEREQLGCAACHGELAQGERGPRLAGGRSLEDFRRVHAGGLFPRIVVGDDDFGAINAWLTTLGRPEDGKG